MEILKMKTEKTNPDDDYKIRCPRLGHQISFSYCLSENNGLPCFMTINCWNDHFDAEEFLRKRLSQKDWEKVFNRPPKPKVVSLVELIEKAKKRTMDKA
ncbi:MAG TPA: hypothetical protein PK874_10680 [Desulfobacteraceae bacterium]|nr:hypothetical protein [Desulfobacteraceae bacterium]HPJ67963.1 hypothetical protein [Desulfobacteraceae bacterium]HPQ28291.1 hypothetical protein [Desulfobacteraceae bacterium]